MRLVRAIAVLTCAVLLASIPSAAIAMRARHQDAVGDAARSPIGVNAYTPSPRAVEGDIKSIRVVHAQRTVWIRVRFRELSTTTNGNFHLVGIRSDRRDRSIELDALPGHWDGGTVVRNAHGQTVSCRVRHRIDYDLNQLRIGVPRSCLGKPSWVRVGVRTTVAGTKYAYVDDARAIGYSATLVYGHRIHR
jgi:hypothetical protein